MGKLKNKPTDIAYNPKKELSESERKLLEGAYGGFDTSRAGELIYNAIKPKKVSLIRKFKNFLIKLLR